MKLIFEKSSPGRTNFQVPSSRLAPKKNYIDSSLKRNSLALPEVGELDVVRHYTRLSQKNAGIDSVFYPLGSCTMKYNPRMNEETARLQGFASTHPLQPESLSQGNLELLFELEKMLCEITGMKRVSLQPAAGAQGEITGLMIVKAFFKKKGEKRSKVLVTDSSHGTNPASATVCGFESVEVKSDARGNVDLDDLRAKMSHEVAALMLTNPNTLGLFDEHILEITKIVHGKGGLVYCDGANLNAIAGKTRPAEAGFDVMHLNLHKTFSTPHGGGGPGAGPVGVTEKLVPFLPNPRVEKQGEKFFLDFSGRDSIGKVKGFYGNFGVLVRAYTYILAHGAEGVRKNSENAVLNANYLISRLKGTYHLEFNRTCMHECVFSDKTLANGVTTLDVAKRLLDFGFHAPTIYFPLIVHGAIMIEPTESESKQTLDEFADAMLKIFEEAKSNPDVVKNAPITTPIGRLDAVKAAREPVIRWMP